MAYILSAYDIYRGGVAVLLICPMTGKENDGWGNRNSICSHVDSLLV